MIEANNNFVKYLKTFAIKFFLFFLQEEKRQMSSHVHTRRLCVSNSLKQKKQS